jgi:serralysin
LSYSNNSTGNSITVNLATGTATGFTSIFNIENVTGSRNANTLVGNNLANNLIGGAGKDILTSGLGGDTFGVTNLAHSSLASFDHITDLEVSTDSIDGAVAIAAGGVADLGGVASLNATSIGTVLTVTTFGANQAATFTVGSRTFLALNNAVAGFQAGNDGIIEITGYGGNLANLAII